MIVLKNKMLFPNEYCYNCSYINFGKFNGAQYLATAIYEKSSHFAAIKNIIIYDDEEKKEICNFLSFKDINTLKNIEIKIGESSNAESFIFGENKKWEVKRRTKIKFEGDAFFIGQASYMQLYLPKQLFIFENKTEYIERTPILKKRYDHYFFRLKKYPNNLFEGMSLIEEVPFKKNEKFIKDYYKLCNKRVYSSTTLDKIFNNEVKDKIKEEFKYFLEKYKNFEVEQ